MWKELSRRNATVLIHPTSPKGYAPMPEQRYCPCPAFEFPHETTRCVRLFFEFLNARLRTQKAVFQVSDIIMSGRRKEFPDVNIILCHGGCVPLFMPYVDF